MGKENDHSPPLSVASEAHGPASVALEQWEREKERRLFAAAQRGEGRERERAMAQLVQKYERLVVSIARDSGFGGRSFEDALQEGRVALFEAIQRFQPERGFCFSTYATERIGYAILRAFHKDRPVHVPEAVQQAIKKMWFIEQ